MAAFIPMALAAPYATTKHAVLGLSTSLRAVAAREGIRVSVLCPGAVRTPTLLASGEFCIDRTGLTTQYLAEYWEKFRPIDADEFARQALKAVARDRAIAVIPSWWRPLWWLARTQPSLTIKLMQKDNERQLASLGERTRRPRTARQGDRA